MAIYLNNLPHERIRAWLWKTCTFYSLLY